MDRGDEEFGIGESFEVFADTATRGHDKMRQGICASVYAIIRQNDRFCTVEQGVPADLTNKFYLTDR